jgi:hypothetical protein
MLLTFGALEGLRLVSSHLLVMKNFLAKRKYDCGSLDYMLETFKFRDLEAASGLEVDTELPSLYSDWLL